MSVTSFGSRRSLKTSFDRRRTAPATARPGKLSGETSSSSWATTVDSASILRIARRRARSSSLTARWRAASSSSSHAEPSLHAVFGATRVKAVALAPTAAPALAAPALTAAPALAAPTLAARHEACAAVLVASLPSTRAVATHVEAFCATDEDIV
eukprot:scaffold47559_cov65-Phaeocystis_antarctica.AAC.3